MGRFIDSLPKPNFILFIEKIPTEYKLLILFTFIFLFGLGYIQREVPNLQYINSTDPRATPIEIKGGSTEGFSQLVLYDQNDIVPAGRASNLWLILYGVICIGTIIYVSTKRVEVNFISAEQARRIIYDWWEHLRTHGVVEGTLNLYKPFPQQHLRTRELDGVVKPYEWVIPGENIIEGYPTYMVFGVNPINQHIYMAVKSTREFSRRDLCPNCGEYSDAKIIGTEEYERFKNLMMGQKK